MSGEFNWPSFSGKCMEINLSLGALNFCFFEAGVEVN